MVQEIADLVLLHKNEDPRLGLAREVKEEPGLDVEVGRPFDVFVEQCT